MKKLAGLVAGGILLAGAGTIYAQTIVANPYTTVGNTLQVANTSIIPDAGTETAILDKTQPKLTLQKFNGEISMGVTLQGLSATAVKPSIFSPAINWTSGNEQMQVVPLAASSTMEDGGYEINVVLASEPATNTINFSISGASNLNFYYQAPLWQEAGLGAPTAQCTDTDCTTSDGTSHRPDNVVGSYAVYYAGHANHVEGQTNYATGKAYQIYRPQVTDNIGSTTWASLSYNAGILTVTVPQNFLDNASYPIIVDPTLGYTTQGASTAGFSANRAYADIATSTEAGTVTDIQANVSSVSGTGFHVKAYFSVDNTYLGSNPTLVTNGIGPASASITSTSKAWVTMTYTTGPTFVTNTAYLPGVVEDAAFGVGNLSEDSVSPIDSRQDTANNYTSPLSTWGSPSAVILRYSIYADYTAAATATPFHSIVTQNKSTMTIAKASNIITIP